MRKICILVLLVVFGLAAKAQTSIPKAQSMFIYNFSRLIEWPEKYRSGDFKIGVLGSNELYDELTGYTTGKKVGTQNISVEKYKEPAEINNCHILFVAFGKSNKMAEITSKVNSSSTLIISEKKGTIDEGACINFLIVGNSLKFELKPSNALSAGLKLSPKLNEMAVEVF